MNDSAAIPAPETRRRLLVVDDEDTVRNVVAHLGRMLGFEVVAVADGRQAELALARAPFDAIVTDVFMPEKDGLELIREQRRLRPGTLIIAMSGGGQFGFDSLKTAEFLGATHVLHKPFGIDELVALLRGLSPAPKPVLG